MAYLREVVLFNLCPKIIAVKGQHSSFASSEVGNNNNTRIIGRIN
jgi:hypothetical protein